MRPRPIEKRGAVLKLTTMSSLHLSAVVCEITSPASWPFRKVSGRATHYFSRHWGQ
jgi:hypothetical protein